MTLSVVGIIEVSKIHAFCSKLWQRKLTPGCGRLTHQKPACVRWTTYLNAVFEAQFRQKVRSIELTQQIENRVQKYRTPNSSFEVLGLNPLSSSSLCALFLDRARSTYCTTAFLIRSSITEERTQSTPRLTRNSKPRGIFLSAKINKQRMSLVGGVCHTSIISLIFLRTTAMNTALLCKNGNNLIGFAAEMFSGTRS